MVLLCMFCGSSCEDDDPLTLDGTWHCREYSSIRDYRQYTVMVERGVSDTTLLTIYNFYDLGFDFETYVRLRDTVLTIIGTSAPNSITGTGYLNRKSFTINWEYSVTGAQLSDYNVEAQYYKR